MDYDFTIDPWSQSPNGSRAEDPQNQYEFFSSTNDPFYPDAVFTAGDQFTEWDPPTTTEETFMGFDHIESGDEAAQEILDVVKELRKASE